MIEPVRNVEPYSGTESEDRLIAIAERVAQRLISDQLQRTQPAILVAGVLLDSLPRAEFKGEVRAARVQLSELLPAEPAASSSAPASDELVPAIPETVVMGTAWLDFSAEAGVGVQCLRVGPRLIILGIDCS